MFSFRHVSPIDLLAMVMSAVILVGLLGIWWALKYGKDYPLRTARECIESLFNVWIVLPILDTLRLDKEEWKNHSHSREYIAALQARRENERAVHVARELYISTLLREMDQDILELLDQEMEVIPA